MSTQLRDGSIVEDVRLDRIAMFDERSRSFPIRTMLKASRPRSYTWRCLNWLDQGREGACVGFGIGHELIARPAEAKTVDYSYARQQIYWEAQRIDPWAGGAYPGASPFYEGTSVLAGVKVARRLGWFESYRWAFGLEDLMMGVGYNGPAVLGLAWFEGMFWPDSDGYIHPTGRCVGGHCILCRAVNVKARRFTLRNSWGKGWGMDGDCYVTFEEMDTLLRQRGEAVFFLKRHRKAQP